MTSHPMTFLRAGPGVLIVAAVAAACGSAQPARGNWAYTGSDPALRAPTFAPATGASPEALRQQAQHSLEAWRSRFNAALALDQAQCAQQSGEPATPDAWSGYSTGFLACMSTKGWSRVGNPA
jgi:hypothetical protein